jgi:tetratricopeptide (TPR) repeat protein
MYRRAADLDPKDPRPTCNLGMVLGGQGHFAEAETAFRKTVELEKDSVRGHLGLGFVVQEQGKHLEAINELRWVLRELDPIRKPHDSDLIDGIDGKYLTAANTLVRSLLCLGRFDEARLAAQRSLELSYTNETMRQPVRRQFEIARQLTPLEDRLPYLLTGQDIPPDLATQRALAEWLYEYRRLPVATVRVAEACFAKQPALVDNLEAQDRFRAACAAALAGCGLGKDADGLTEDEKSALRGKALAWLRAEHEARARQHRSGSPGERSNAARALQGWGTRDDLAGVRDPERLARRPEAERHDWEALWADVKTLAARDPFAALDQARAHVAKKEWSRAAENYTRAVEEAPGFDGEVWFELAAAQLLAGDEPGYRRTCQRMLAGAPDTPPLRPYLVTRACTLAPGAVGDLSAPRRMSATELEQNGGVFWSLTEQGALRFREGRPREAVQLFEQSLRADGRPAVAVLNWLWLALAHDALGDRKEARRWLDRAATWLDGLGNELSASSAAKLHRHNWLEAHILRREAERLLGPGSSRP